MAFCVGNEFQIFVQKLSHHIEPPPPGYRIQSNGLEYRVVQPDGTVCTGIYDTSYDATLLLAREIARAKQHEQLPWHDVTNK